MSVLRILLALSALVPAASSAAIVGRLDRADATAALGWACVEGDATRTLEVRIETRASDALEWSPVETVPAHGQRDDVLASGLCDAGEDARWHGFELTTWPAAMLAVDAAHEVRAVALDGGTGSVLPGAATIAFRESGFPTRAVWRTDYDDPEQREVTLLGCVFPYEGANRRGNEALDPRMMNAGATVTVPWVRHPERGGTEPDWCVMNGPADHRAWSSSNAATNAPEWPLADFWVVSANSEPAYSRTQGGPPGQSEPVNAGGVYGVDADAHSFTLSIDNRPPYTGDDFPFLSIGASQGHGIDGLVARVATSGADRVLEYTITPLRMTDAVDEYGRAHYHDVNLFVEATWGGYKRLVYVSFASPVVGTRRWWNWNVLESFWFPGGEINFLGWRELRACAGIDPAGVPAIDASSIGTAHAVRLPLRALFECVESRAPALGWTVPRDPSLPIAITGVHLGLEQADYQPGSGMAVRFSRPTVSGAPPLFADGFE